MSQRIRRQRVRDTFLLSGWLFADLLLGLMIIFMVSAPPPPPQQTPCPTATAAASSPTPSACPTPTNTPTPTSTPQEVTCGLDLSSLRTTDILITVLDPGGLSNDTSDGQSSFNAQVQQALASYSQKIAGLVEIFGGGANVSDGQAFATHAQTALQILKQRHTFFDDHTFFQPFGDETLASNQIKLSLLFYLQLPNGQPCG